MTKKYQDKVRTILKAYSKDEIIEIAVKKLKVQDEESFINLKNDMRRYRFQYLLDKQKKLLNRSENLLNKMKNEFDLEKLKSLSNQLTRVNNAYVVIEKRIEELQKKGNL